MDIILIDTGPTFQEFAPPEIDIELFSRHNLGDEIQVVTLVLHDLRCLLRRTTESDGVWLHQEVPGMVGLGADTEYQVCS